MGLSSCLLLACSLLLLLAVLVNGTPSNVLTAHKISDIEAQVRAAIVRGAKVVDSNNDRRSLEGLCPETCIDFSKAGNGTELRHGDYVGDDWYAKYGMGVSAFSTSGYTPSGKVRIFDSSLYDTLDSDLSSPNEECPGGGPGIGEGGKPGTPGANCEPQGNVIIIQESEKAEPDDNAYGGIISFSFNHPGKHISKLGLMDMEGTQNFLILYKSDGSYPYVKPMTGLGDNSIQDEFIDKTDVTSLNVFFSDSCGIREICFCQEEEQMPKIVSFSLVNSEINEDIIEVLTNGTTLFLSGLPDINIRANTENGDTIGSVTFLIDGAPVRTENFAPWALAGDDEGNYFQWATVLGPQMLTAIAYEGEEGKGAELSRLSLSFDIQGALTRSPTPGPTPNPTPRPTARPTKSPNPTPVALPTTKPTLAPVSGPSVTGFTLVNADNNQDISSLVDGTSLFLQDLPDISIRADTVGTVGSVKFYIDDSEVRVENVAPFVVNGDDEGDYFPWEPKSGPQILTAIIYDEAGAKGEIIHYLSVSFSVFDENDLTFSPTRAPVTTDTSKPPANPSSTPTQSPSASPSIKPTPVPTATGPIVGFTLVNADNDIDIEPLVDGSELFLSSLPPINIRANTNKAVGSVVFYINGIVARVENVSPYALNGDSSGDYFPWLPATTGSLLLEAFALEKAGGKGAVLGGLSITLFVYGDEVTASQVPSASPTMQSASPSASSPSTAPSGADTVSSSPTNSPTPAPTPNPDENCPYKKLTWDDFKGPAPRTSDEDAVIASGIQQSAYETGVPTKQPDQKWLVKMKKISASAFMDKTQSGVKDGSKTDTLLEHEQYHFDISQYWARKLDKALKAAEATGATPDAALDALEMEVDRIYNLYRQKLQKMQNDYDTETNHSRNAAKQREWCEKIGKLLNPPGPVAPRSDGSSSTMMPSGNVEKGSDGNLTLSHLSLNSFFDELGSQIDDGYLQAAKLKLPRLAFEGLFMNDPMRPLFYPHDATDALVELIPTGDPSTPAMTGKLLLLMGDGLSLRGWIEMADISDSGLGSSSYLETVNRVLYEGGGVLTVEFDIHHVSSPDYTGPFTAIGNIRLGVNGDVEATDAQSAMPSMSPSEARSLLPTAPPSTGL